MVSSPRRMLSGSTLKWIAMGTMLVDHVSKVFAGRWLPALAGASGLGGTGTTVLYTALFGIGSMTVYIFAWMIAEGCRYTRSFGRYLGRLLLFAAVSEAPFQLMLCAIGGEPLRLHIGLTNVLFTLALGAVACRGYRTLLDRGWRAWALLLPVICMAAAALLGTDYGLFGVLAVFVCYAVDDRRNRLLALSGVIVLCRGIVFPVEDILAYGFEAGYLAVYALELAWSLFAVPVLAAYDGTRGKRGMKYLFYLFYPIHMSVLVLLYSLTSR